MLMVSLIKRIISRIARKNRGSSFLSKGETGKWLQVLSDQVVVSGTSFLTGAIIGRAFGKNQFGLYILGYSIITIIVEIQSSFISSPYTIKSPRLKEDALFCYTGSVLILLIGLSALSTIFLAAWSALISHGVGPREITAIWWPLSVIMGCILLKEFGRRVCFAHLNIRIVLFLDIIVSVVQISGLILLALLGFHSVAWVFWIMGIASGIAGVVWIIIWRKQLILKLPDAVATLKESWSFGSWVLAGNLAFLLAQQLYPWYLTLFKGVEATGVLAACLGILAFLNPLISGIGNFLGPKTAAAYIEGVGKLWSVVVKTTIFVSAAVGLFCLMLILFGEQIVVLVYGRQYAGISGILTLLAISMFASNSTLAVGFGFWAVGRPDINCKINLIALGITLTLGLVLVKYFGVLGVAYGFLCASVTVSGVRLATFTRLTRLIQSSH